MKTRKTAADRSIDSLIDNGWTVSHNALTSGYIYAGAIREMQSRKGRNYCRVYHGKCVNKRDRNGWHALQITTVLYKDIEK